MVVVVFGLAGDADEDEGDDVGEEVRDRVDGFGDHRTTMPSDSDEELQ